MVAAFAIGRRVIMLAMMPAWGYSTAASRWSDSRWAPTRRATRPGPFYGKALGLGARLAVAALALSPAVVVTIAGFAITPGFGFGLAAVYAAIVID